MNSFLGFSIFKCGCILGLYNLNICLSVRFWFFWQSVQYRHYPQMNPPPCGLTFETWAAVEKRRFSDCRLNQFNLWKRCTHDYVCVNIRQHTQESWNAAVGAALHLGYTLFLCVRYNSTFWLAGPALIKGWTRKYNAHPLQRNTVQYFHTYWSNVLCDTQTGISFQQGVTAL